MLPQPTRLTRQRHRAATRHRPRGDIRREHRQRGQPRFAAGLRRGLRRLVLRRRLFQDHVRVRAADPERRHTRPPRPVTRLPLLCFLEQLDVPGRPVHVGGGSVGVQRLRQEAMPHGQHHLDDARDAGRLLGVADVRLDRAQPQRPVTVGTFLTVGGQQGLGLNRVAQLGARAVRLHHIHIGRGDLRVRQRGTDDAALRGAVRRRETVRRAVLVHGAAADHGEHLVPVAPRVREALQQDHARALAPADAVGLVRERLAPAAGGHAALLGEVHERVGQGHDRDAAGQRHRALAAAERRHRLVQGNQRGGARGVHRHRRARQTQGVRDASRVDGRHVPGEPVAVQARVVGGQNGGVSGVVGADEDTGGRAVQRVRVDPGPFDRLPGRLQQQPLLRVHRQRLTRADPEEPGVEVGDVVEESALPGVGLPGPHRRVAELLLERLPAAVGGESAHRVRARDQQFPELLGAADVARVAAAHSDNRDRLAPGGSHHLHRAVGRRRADEFASYVFGERGGVRVVEDHRRRQ